MNAKRTAAAAGTIDVGGDLTINRLGFGAMRITGPGIARSPQILPIPGSGSPEHVEQNVAAASIELSPDEISAITKAA